MNSNFITLFSILMNSILCIYMIFFIHIGIVPYKCWPQAFNNQNLMEIANDFQTLISIFFSILMKFSRLNFYKLRHSTPILCNIGAHLKPSCSQISYKLQIYPNCIFLILLKFSPLHLYNFSIQN